MKNKSKTKNCKICEKEFMASPPQNKYCSEECRKKGWEEIKLKSKIKTKKEIQSIENIDYVVCKLCGEQVKRIYGKHLKFFHSNITSKEYKNMFPGALLSSFKDKYNISKNSGKHMKEEKWRKWASIKMKGNKNINHKQNTTLQERKERSPFSKDFYKKRNLTKEDKQNFIKEALFNRVSATSLEYWLEKTNGDLKKAKELLKDRQTTFSLEKCIKKYGKEEGLNRWKERQEKWKAKVFNKDTYIGRGESQLSSNIINKIIKHNIKNHNLLYGKNEKFVYDKFYKRVYKYDLTNQTNKKIIEINGVYWHCKPSLYESNYIHKVKNMTAKEIWKYDKRKIDIAKRNGYLILKIWEDDYNYDPRATIEKCIQFIYN